MICRECRPLLEEYLDGELAPRVGKVVAGHLAACHGCTAQLNELRSELELFQHYSPEIEVTQDLWVGLQARLGEQKPLFTNQQNSRLPGWIASIFSAPRVSVPVTVALMVVAVIVTVFVMDRISQSGKDNLAVQSTKKVESPNRTEVKTGVPETVAKNPVGSLSGPERFKRSKTDNTERPSTVSRSFESKTPEQLVREAERKYLAAIGMLSRDIARIQSQLDSDTRMKLEQALASIDRTIGSTREAVRKHPEDPVAVQYMLAAYARKVDVLREMAGGGPF
ncbi:MAG TPA: zf-HC2 domain-containing protein [Pyrinomonadaceae bacterium]|nr:zf-HC2 domain-containing protein [Pyrinomonadaceae bacterium]